MTDLSFTENVNFDKLASQESSYSTKIDPEKTTGRLCKSKWSCSGRLQILC